MNNNPSTSINSLSATISSSVKCTICHKEFTARGINIHIARSHSDFSQSQSQSFSADSTVNNSQTTLISSTNISDNSPSHNLEPPIPCNLTKCDMCGRFFKSINRHYVRSHPEVHRNIINKAYQLSTSTSDIPVPADNTITVISPIKSNISEWVQTFETLTCLDIPDHTTFDKAVQDFCAFLKSAITYCKGPEHPSTKYYKYRQKKKTNPDAITFKRTNNPKRVTKRLKERRKNKFNFELAQFHYYYQRRKVVQHVMSTSSKIQCTIASATVSEYYTNLFGDTNNCSLDNYPSIVDYDDEDSESIVITEADIVNACKGIKVDTAPGDDGVRVKVIKELRTYKPIHLLATYMLRWGHVPPCLQRGKTILLYKSGNPEDVKNWRPITIFSVVRRIIERALDKKLRSYVTLNINQRGFMSTPGAFINSSILNGCLKDSKLNHKDCCVIFLDISKAFDNVSHKHIEQTLNTFSIPPKFKALITALQQGNSTSININKTTRTSPIFMKKGVAQGAPLSPILFNIAIDFILNELSDKEIIEEYGYSVTSDLDNISTLAFADDLVLLCKNEAAAKHLVTLVTNSLSKIGLTINAKKSRVISLQKGQLNSSSLFTSDKEIPSIAPDESIKYLGITFQDEIKFNSTAVIDQLTKNLNLLVASHLLTPDQKLNILNQYIWPQIVYPFQCAPLKDLKIKFLKDIDKLIRSSVKEIIGLPTDVPDAMLYASRKFRGLGIFKAQWEAFLQHLNICRLLLNEDNPYIAKTRDLKAEIDQSLNRLPLSPDGIDNINIRNIRKKLREDSFKQWSELPGKGKGITFYSHWKKGNAWISNKKRPFQQSVD